MTGSSIRSHAADRFTIAVQKVTFDAVDISPRSHIRLFRPLRGDCRRHFGYHEVPAEASGTAFRKNVSILNADDDWLYYRECSTAPALFQRTAHHYGRHTEQWQGRDYFWLPKSMARRIASVSQSCPLRDMARSACHTAGNTAQSVEAFGRHYEEEEITPRLVWDNTRRPMARVSDDGDGCVITQATFLMMGWRRCHDFFFAPPTMAATNCLSVHARMRAPLDIISRVSFTATGKAAMTYRSFAGHKRQSSLFL